MIKPNVDDKTDVTNLITQYTKLGLAIDNAIDEFHGFHPDEKDYSDTATYKKAVEEYMSELYKLITIEKSLNEIMRYLYYHDKQ